MKNIEMFSQSEMSETQEKQFVESLYSSHYDSKLKNDYSVKLATRYNVNRKSVLHNTAKKSSKLRYLIMGAAAIAAIFAMILVFMPMINNGMNANPQQYAQSLVTIDKMDVNRGQQEESQSRLDIKQSYNAERWGEVISLYEQLGELTREDLYFKGKTFLYLQKYDEAVTTLSGISNTEDFKFYSELQYWLAVSYVSNQEFLKAEPLLQELASSDWYKDKAQELLKSIQ